MRSSQQKPPGMSAFADVEIAICIEKRATFGYFRLLTSQCVIYSKFSGLFPSSE